MSVRNMSTGEIVLVYKTDSDHNMSITLGDGLGYEVKKITEAQFETLTEVLGVKETSAGTVDIVELVKSTHDIYSSKKIRN